MKRVFHDRYVEEDRDIIKIGSSIFNFSIFNDFASGIQGSVVTGGNFSFIDPKTYSLNQSTLKQALESTSLVNFFLGLERYIFK